HRTGGLYHQIGPFGGDLAQYVHRIGRRSVDRVISAEFGALGQPTGAGTDQDHLAGAELLACLNRHQSDRSRPNHHHGVADDVPAGGVQAEQACSCSGYEHGVVVGDVVRHLVQRGHMVHRVLGETTVHGHSAGAMAFGDVTVVHARGVKPGHTVPAPAASVVCLDADPVSGGDLVHALAAFNDHTGPPASGGMATAARS